MAAFRVSATAVGESRYGGQGENSSNQDSRKLLHEELLFSFLFCVTQVTLANVWQKAFIGQEGF
jgi:hypothetical protein